MTLVVKTVACMELTRCFHGENQKRGQPPLHRVNSKSTSQGQQQVLPRVNSQVWLSRSILMLLRTR